MLLTGTPLQNNVDELFSLLSFLEPRQFSSSEQFIAEFGRLETESQVDKLKAVSIKFCAVVITKYRKVSVGVACLLRAVRDIHRS